MGSELAQAASLVDERRIVKEDVAQATDQGPIVLHAGRTADLSMTLPLNSLRRSDLELLAKVVVVVKAAHDRQVLLLS